MASFALVLDNFDMGDCYAGLRMFECCAMANNWSVEENSIKLPAYLRGPAAAHFHSLANLKKESYATLTKHLKDDLCPRFNREKFYSPFYHRKLQPTV